MTVVFVISLLEFGRFAKDDGWTREDEGADDLGRG